MEYHLQETRHAEHKSLEGIQGAMTVQASRLMALSYDGGTSGFMLEGKSINTMA